MNKYPDDKVLVDMFKSGENPEKTFNIIIDKYQESIYWHVRRILIDHEDANDTVQNVFIKVWKNLNSFRGESKLYTWLYRIATNEAISFLKNKRKRFLVPFADVENELSNKLETDNFFKGDEIQKKLQKAILTLPEKQRIVFNLRYFDEMKYEDISQIMNTSTGALKASYHIAAKKVEDFLKND